MGCEKRGAFGDTLMKKMNFVYRLVTLFVFFVLVLPPAETVAETNQFFFTALAGPAVSLSDQGGSGNVVYLRWGSLLQQMPVDVTRYRLLRQAGTDPAVQLGEFNTAIQVTSEQISRYYSGPANQRRRAEMISWLDQLALNPRVYPSSQPLPSRVTGDNFAAVLAGRINKNGFWAKMACRHDINIARAMGLAYIDQLPPAGLLRYTLLAVTGPGQEERTRKLGEAMVDTAAPKPVPAVNNLELVTDLGRCDAPESGKQHGVVALNWSHGGSTVSEQYVTSLLVSGYDIYRARGSFTLGTTLRQAALAGSFDSATGAPQIPGLERVNEQPVMISGTVEKEPGTDSGYGQFMETIDELAARGYHPGDLVTYYVVPRDITGNYGQEARIEFYIPDMRIPPSPWDVDTSEKFNDPPEQNYLSLRWSEVNLDNFIRDYGATKVFCNMEEAKKTGFLRYVHEGESCSEDVGVELNFNVREYLLYRFASVKEARAFMDTDGDGYSDLDEQAGNTVCDPARHPATGSRLVGVDDGDPATPPNGLEISLDVLDDGRRMLTVDDAEPANGANVETVYWYMLAARADNGRISLLSQPIRGFFPNRNLPDRPAAELKVFDCPVDYDRTAEGEGRYIPPVLPAHGPGQVPLPARITDYTGLAGSYRLRCSRNSELAGELVIFLDDAGDGSAAGETTPGQCAAFLAQCGTGATFEGMFVSHGGYDLAQRTIPQNPATCTEMYASLSSDEIIDAQAAGEAVCEDRPLQSGEPPTKKLKLVFDAPTRDCVNLYRDMGEEKRLVKTLCPDTVPPEVCDTIEDQDGKAITGCSIEHIPGMPGTDVCYSITFSNANAVESPSLQFPCLREPTPRVAAPQLSRLSYVSGQDRAVIRIHLPEQRLGGVVLEWYAKKGVNGDTRQQSFVPASKKPEADGTLEAKLNITPEPAGSDWSELWCVRARGTGFANRGKIETTMSEWTPYFCADRLPTGTAQPDYLGWPAVKMPPEGDSLKAFYLPKDGIPVVFLSEDIPWSDCAAPGGGSVKPISEENVCSGEAGDNDTLCLPTVSPSYLMTCGPDYCDTIRGMLEQESYSFVVYRQYSSGNAPNNSTEFVQVSPLISTMYCVDNYIDDPQTQTRVFDKSIFDDPFIGLLMFSVPVNGPPNGVIWEDPIMANRLRAVFTDQTPHLVDSVNRSWYRYQIVYFDAHGEAVTYRTSNWIEAK
jgi:hypothetical protein